MKIFLFILLFGLGLFAPQSSTDWSMYPNPVRTRSYFTIEVKEGVLPCYIKIIDMNGKVILYKYLGEDLMFARIEVFFRPGTYVVYLEDK